MRHSSASPETFFGKQLHSFGSATLRALLVCHIRRDTLYRSVDRHFRNHWDGVKNERRPRPKFGSARNGGRFFFRTDAQHLTKFFVLDVFRVFRSVGKHFLGGYVQISPYANGHSLVRLFSDSEPDNLG